MEIEYRAAPIIFLHLADCPVVKHIGQQPEETASACGQRPVTDFYCCHWQFNQIRSSHRCPCKTRRSAPAIMVMPDWRDTRRISIALLGQYRMRPGRALVYRK